MPVETESVLGLVRETLLASAVNSLVLAAAELVADGLGVSLAGVGLSATSDLVGATGDALLRTVEAGLGGIWSLNQDAVSTC